MKEKQLVLGHQAPKKWRVNTFNYIEVKEDFAYCASHNFFYNTDVEREKLYNGQPCFYTDIRYLNGRNNFYKSSYLHMTRRKDISLKACIRKTLKCKGIPKGTIVEFQKSWYYPGKKFSGKYKFKIRKENPIEVKYEINKPSYSKQFTDCEFSQKLTTALREHGFIVSVEKNESFLTNMINTAVSFTGNSDFRDSAIEGETAEVYGYGKKIGFSSFNNDFYGYSNGCENILWDRLGEFDKWSRCNEISKTASIEEILEILMEPNPIEDENAI